MRTRTGNALGSFQGLLVLATACVVFFFIYARRSAHDFLYAPPQGSYERDGRFERLEVEGGAALNVFWAGSKADAWTVLYFCGNEEDIGTAMPRLQTYRLRGFNVACFDYRGYGYSEGEPSESTLYADAEQVYDFLLREKGVSESRLALHGRSVGGGVAVELATRRDPAGLVLESTFTSVYNAILKMKWVPGDSFRSARKASKTDCPVLVIHGVDDSIVDVAEGAALAEAFGDSRAVFFPVEDAGHRNVDRVGGLAYWTGIYRFIRGLE